MSLITPIEGLMVVGGVIVLRFAMEVAAVVVGLMLWDRFLRRRA